jgi:hypothetical protein
MNNYEKQAQDFLNQTQTTFKAEFIKNDFHFDGDQEKRDIYKITLQRGTRKMVFNFGQSLNNSGFYFTQGVKKVEIDKKFLELDLSESQLKTKLIQTIRQACDKIHYPKAPTPYDILAGLQNYEVGSFENFCDEFDYNVDSKKAEKTYNAVLKEWQEVQKLWSDEEIALLQEIS